MGNNIFYWPVCLYSMWRFQGWCMCEGAAVVRCYGALPAITAISWPEYGVDSLDIRSAYITCYPTPQSIPRTNGVAYSLKFSFWQVFAWTINCSNAITMSKEKIITNCKYKTEEMHKFLKGWRNKIWFHTDM
jgi:hypothetical protein